MAISSNEVLVLFLFRLFERFVLTGVIVLISVIVMFGLWRTWQKIDFNLSKEKVGSGAVSTILATPVLVLLTLVGFAWVVLSNPISLEVKGPIADISAQGNSPPKPAADNKPAAVADIRLHGITTQNRNDAAKDDIASLNCLIDRHRPISIEEDMAIRRIKGSYVLSNWQTHWGKDADKESFWQWINGNLNASISGDSIGLFHEGENKCGSSQP